jgi:hypothetical protein
LGLSCHLLPVVAPRARPGPAAPLAVPAAVASLASPRRAPRTGSWPSASRPDARSSPKHQRLGIPRVVKASLRHCADWLSSFPRRPGAAREGRRDSATSGRGRREEGVPGLPDAVDAVLSAQGSELRKVVEKPVPNLYSSQKNKHSRQGHVQTGNQGSDSVTVAFYHYCHRVYHSPDPAGSRVSGLCNGRHHSPSLE